MTSSVKTVDKLQKLWDLLTVFSFTIEEILKKLISAASGRFPRARLQPIEQRRVRFVIISAVFAEVLQPLLPTLRFWSQKPFFVTAFASLSPGSSARAVPAGVAALRSNQRKSNDTFTNYSTSNNAIVLIFNQNR